MLWTLTTTTAACQDHQQAQFYRAANKTEHVHPKSCTYNHAEFLTLLSEVAINTHSSAILKPGFPESKAEK